LRISKDMNRYVYQIQGALENPFGQFIGFRVLVCDVNHLDAVDVPAEILDRETRKYLEFRFGLTDDKLNIQSLPIKIQNNLRAPLGHWLDRWVLENFYGDISDTKGVNP